MAGTSETWTNTYRGPDDAAMIGAFVRDAGVAAARGWHAVEQTWGEEDGARTLRVRYERDPAAATGSVAATGTGAPAEPTPDSIIPAWRTPEPVTTGTTTPEPVAPTWGKPAAVAARPPAVAPGPAAVSARPVARSGIRSGIANTGALLFGVGAAVVLLLPSTGTIQRAGFSAAALGLATWLVTRAWGGLALRRLGVRSMFGSSAGVIGAGIVAALLASYGVSNLPLPGGSTAATDVPVASAAPLLTETPIEPALIIDSPTDGDVIGASSVAVSGIASPGSAVTCSRGASQAFARTNELGEWWLQIDLVGGTNIIVCQLDDDSAPDAVVTVESVPTAGDEPSPPATPATSAPATGEPDPSGSSDTWFTIGSGGGPDPFGFGPFELPAGVWTATWTVTGSPGCDASFTMEANPDIGFEGATFTGTAGPDGTATDEGTFTTTASGSHRLVAQVDCDSWTVSFGPPAP